MHSICPEEATMSKKPKNKLVRTAIGIGVTSLISAAIVDQLRRPTDERTWQGTILGIPYDFRPPTPEKLYNTFWNKDTAKIFVPHAFGIGWSINFYPLIYPKPASEEASNSTEPQ
jgi:hypothetical protein